MAEQAAGNAGSSERRTLSLVLLSCIPIALILLCCLPVGGPVFRILNLPSTSMLPSLSAGSSVIVSRASYGYSRFSFDALDLPIKGRLPAFKASRGDVVAFRIPRDRTTIYIKRVVGLPGDEISMKGGVLFINGTPVPKTRKEDFVMPNGGKPIPSYEERLPEGASYLVLDSDENGHYDNAGPFKVPPEHYFMMGDHRDNSLDSREQSPQLGMGFVPSEMLIGRVVFVY